MANLRQRLRSLGASELIGPTVRLEPLGKAHREALRAACAADSEIWQIYLYSMLGDHFDAWWEQRDVDRIAFAAIHAGRLVGMSSYYDTDDARKSTAIGGTYFEPAVRGAGINAEVKQLMLGAAFDAGARRVEFHIDAINGRSRRAIEKIGAVFEGILRQERVTWTGRVRDTCVYSVLESEWPAVRARLA